MKPRYSSFIVVVLSCCAGCTKPASQTQQTALNTTPNNRGPSLTEENPDVETIHDFGTRFSQNQLLTHEFTISNDSDYPVRILNVETYIPCCSTIGAMPDVIAARAKLRVPVTFKPGYQAGPKQAGFLIHTNSAVHANWQLLLRANLISAYEFTILSDQNHRVSFGLPDAIHCRLVCRKSETEGRGLPASIVASPTLQLRITTPPIGASPSPGVAERYSYIDVTIPPSYRAGPQRGEIRIGWPSGESETQNLVWEVSPPVSASPSGLIVKQSDPQYFEVVVTSTDRPIRIEGAGGELLRDLPTGIFPTKSAKVHHLRLAIVPNANQGPYASKVEILTDHPFQRTLSVSVLQLLPSKNGLR